MTCSHCRDTLHEWLDRSSGALPGPAAEHVRACPDCRAFVSRWNSIELLIQNARDDCPPPSRHLGEAIGRRIHAPAARHIRDTRLAWRAAAVASAAAAAAALYVIAGAGRSAREPDPQAASILRPAPTAPQMPDASAIGPSLPLARTR